MPPAHPAALCLFRRQVLYLVSGVGVPRDQEADPELNSTEALAEVLEIWLKVHYPFVHVR